MKITFLTGATALYPKRVGVSVVHANLLAKAAEHGYMGFDAQIACFASNKRIARAYPSYADEPYADKLRFSSRLCAYLAFLLPIEWIFGHSDLYFCDGIAPFTLHRAKRVGIIHDLRVFVYPEEFKLIDSIYQKNFYYRCKRFDKIVTVSEASKRDIIRFLGIDADKIRVIGCGFTAPKQMSAEEAARVKTNIDFSQPYLLSIGEMRPNKNLLNTIKAVEKVLAHTRIKYYIAGPKQLEYETLSAYVKEHGLENNVVFLGYVSEDEKALLYQNAAGLLFVSYFEGFGIPILEGASYGIPVVTGNTASTGEIAEGYAVTVNPYDADAIAAAIEDILVPEMREKIVARQKALLEKYTWERSYQLLEQAIREALET